MDSYAYNERVFSIKLHDGIKTVKKILKRQRNPQTAGDCPHRWADKFDLAGFLLTTTAASLLQALKNLGLANDFIKKNEKNFLSKTVTIAFSGARTCEFLKKEQRVEKSSNTFVKESFNLMGSKKDISYVESSISEYRWKVTVDWILEIYLGNDSENAETLAKNSGHYEIITAADEAPFPKKKIFDPMSLDLTWLFKNISSDVSTLAGFSIDRANSLCLTPRRNPQAEEAIGVCQMVLSWVSQLTLFLKNYIYVSQDHSSVKLDLSSINAKNIKLVSLPLFQDNATNMTFIEDINNLLEASFQSVNMQLHSLKSVFPAEGPLSLKEASLGCLLHFMDILSRDLLDSFSYLESQIEKQICEALGKHIGPSDFDEFMRYHNRLFFAESQKPKPFSYPIRRVGHVPEGSINLESEVGIIHTITSQSTERQQMFFALNESAKIFFKGETYLHGFLRTNFDDSPVANLKLAAQTRQFSCFILLIGKLISRDQFEPETAIILQNKDILFVDILTEIIPSAKQFKESISSLSPEQQRFAHAFRSMQLSSTLFAFCVVQIKPALEKVLNLPIDALTKEITLTQDLLKLFIEYQIPSDLLSFDESMQNSSNLGVAEKISIVRTNTNRMLEIIDKEKENQMKEKALLDSYKNEAQIQQKKSARVTRCLDEREMVMTISAAPDPKASFTPKVFASESYDPGNTLEQAAQVSPPEYAYSPKSEIDDHKEDLKNDFFMVPQKMDQLFEKYDVAGAVRPTILSAGDWTLKSFPSLLAEQTTRPISKDERKLEKNKAFDLIDALTKSGVIELDSASLHVIIAATHNFQNALMGVLVEENTNPIEKVQASSIIMASCIHNLKFSEVVSPISSAKVKEFCPHLGL